MVSEREVADLHLIPVTHTGTHKCSLDAEPRSRDWTRSSASSSVRSDRATARSADRPPTTNVPSGTAGDLQTVTLPSGRWTNTLRAPSIAGVQSFSSGLALVRLLRVRLVFASLRTCFERPARARRADQRLRIPAPVTAETTGIVCRCTLAS